MRTKRGPTRVALLGQRTRGRPAPGSGPGVRVHRAGDGDWFHFHFQYHSVCVPSRRQTIILCSRCGPSRVSTGPCGPTSRPACSPRPASSVSTPSSRSRSTRGPTACSRSGQHRPNTTPLISTYLYLSLLVFSTFTSHFLSLLISTFPCLSPPLTPALITKVVSLSPLPLSLSLS